MISRSSASAAGEWHGERFRGPWTRWQHQAHQTAPPRLPRSWQASETSSLKRRACSAARPDSVAVALRMPADLAIELRQGLAWRSAEPQERTKLKGVVEHHPDDAAARLILQMAVERDFLALATPIGALELDRAPDPLVAEHELVAVLVDLGRSTWLSCTPMRQSARRRWGSNPRCCRWQGLTCWHGRAVHLSSNTCKSTYDACSLSHASGRHSSAGTLLKSREENLQ